MKKQNLFKTVALLSVFILLLFVNTNLKAQSSVILTVSPDNCMAPTPNSGTYVPTGTLNGKPAYYKNVNLRIVWTGTAWEVQGDDPGIGGVTWVTGWNNTANTPKPPDAGWVANFGCFPITMSGDVSSLTALVENLSVSENLFSVQPNPASGKVNLNFDKMIMKGMVKVYNSLGQVVYCTSIENNSLQSVFPIDLTNQPKGIYFISLKTTQGNCTKKIVLME